MRVTPTKVLEPTEAGTIDGTFTVTPTGQAHYSIPLVLPPGVNSLTPQLSIEYDSSFGHGPMGLGWSIGGASSITRCPITYAQGGAAPISFMDHVEAKDDDMFCLDGIPLVLVNIGGDGGREYRTEFESFVRVWSFQDANPLRSGPARFDVELLDGTVRTYGGSEDSVGLIASMDLYDSWDNPYVAARTSWELSRTVDRFGNYVSFVYHHTPDFIGLISDMTGSASDAPNLPGNYPYPSYFGATYHPLLTEIDYGGNTSFSGNRKVKLETESLKRLGLGSLIRDYWNSGVPRFDFLRYTRITTYFEDKEVRNYRLGYEDDGQVMQLSTVQECYGDACKPPTTLAYGDVPEFNAISPIDVTPPASNGDKLTLRTIQARLDANGDGIEDLLLNPVLDPRNKLDCGKTVTLALGKGGSNNAGVPWEFVELTTLSSCDILRASDVDADGKSEIIRTRQVYVGDVFGNPGYSQSVTFAKYLGNGEFSDWVGMGTIPGYFSNTTSGLFWDDDGDGLPLEPIKAVFGKELALYDADSDRVLEHGLPAQLTEVSDFEEKMLDAQIEAAENDSFVRTIKAEAPNCDRYKCCHTYPERTSCPDHLSCAEASTLHSICTEYLEYTANNWLLGGTKALDSNGDGLKDFVTWYPGGSGLFTILENTGRDRHVTDFASAVYPNTSGRAFRQSFVYDTDRDGRDEVVFVNKDGVIARVPMRVRSLHVGDQDKVTELGRLPMGGNYPGVDERDEFLVMDVDGNATPDILFGDETWRVLYQSGSVSRRLAKITNGLGKVDRVSYAQGKAAPYSETLKQTDSPNTTVLKVIPPVVVGHDVMSTVGAGFTYNEYSEDFSYADARMGRYGRGFLGFREVTRKVRSIGPVQLTEKTTYDVSNYLDVVGFENGPGGQLHHSYPFAGKSLLRTRTYENVPIGIGDNQDLGTVVETDEWKYLLKYGTSFRPYRYLKELSSARREESPANGDRIISSSVTTYEQDDYGAETGVIRSVRNELGDEVERAEVTRKYEFTDLDGGFWARRLPTEITTTSFAGGESSSIKERLKYYNSGAIHERHIGYDVSAVEKKTEFTYNERGNVLTQSESSRISERNNSVTYDARGEFPETKVNGIGRSFTDAYYKGYGVSAVHEDAVGLISRTSIDGFGRVVSIVDVQGNETAISYQRVALASGPAFLEGRARFVETRIQTGLPESRSYYDSLGRKVGTEQVFADGTVKRAAAGFYGTGQKAWNTVREFVGAALPTNLAKYQYDSTGRLLSMRWPNDFASSGVSTVNASYGAPSNWPNDEVGDETLSVASVMVRREYPDGLVETELLDLDGRRIAKIDSAGATTVLRYGPSGRLRELRDAAGLTYETKWDALGRVVGTTDPIRGDGTVTYSSGLSEVVVTTSNAGMITRSNDVLGRVSSEVRPEGTSTWVYDDGPNATGQVLQVIGPSSTLSPKGTVISYTYGPPSGTVGSRGKVRSVARTIAGEEFVFGYNYDKNGRLAEVDYPSAAGNPFKVKLDYDQDGELKLISDGVATVDAEEYWKLIQRTPTREVETERLANALDVNYAYSPLNGKTQTVTQTLGNSEISKSVYSYNESGNLALLGEWENGSATENSRIYDYDGAGRLKDAYIAKLSGNVWSKGGRALGVQFDTLGNIIEKSDVGAYEYGTAGNPYAVSVAGGNSYQYDSLGRQFWRSGPGINGGLQTIDYSSFGQPTTITSGQDDVVRFAYDALHDLTITDEGTKRKIHVGGLYQRTADVNEPGQFTHVYTVKMGDRTLAEVIAHEQAGNVVGDKEVQTIVPDRFGGPITSVNAAGNVSRSHYDEFGRALDTLVSLTDIGYAGYQAAADTGLVRMGVRLYDPVLGRVLSPDGIMLFEMGQDGLNPYAYAYNRPTTYVDPSGFEGENAEFPFVNAYGETPACLTAESEAVVDLMGGNDNWGDSVGFGDGALYSDYASDWAYQSADGQMSLASGQQISGGVATSDVALNDTSVYSDTTAYGTGTPAPVVESASGGAPELKYPGCIYPACQLWQSDPVMLGATVEFLSASYDPGFGEMGHSITAVNISSDGISYGLGNTNRGVPDVGLDVVSANVYLSEFYTATDVKAGQVYGFDYGGYGVNVTIGNNGPVAFGFKRGLDLNLTPIDFTINSSNYFSYAPYPWW